MVRRQHNSARVVGALLVLLGVTILFLSGNGRDILSSAKRMTTISTPSGNSSNLLVVQAEDGEAKLLVARSGSSKRAHGNDTASDPSFQDIEQGQSESFMDFLGISGEDLLMAFQVLLITAGGLLFLASYIRR